MTGKISEDTTVTISDWTETAPILQGGANKQILLSSQRTTVSWTPVVTFVTPGDLVVAYSVQVGEAYRFAGNWVELMFRINTSTFTFTTASGNMMITGSPFAAKTLTNGGWAGSMNLYQGITKANFTLFGPRVLSASNQILLNAAGSAQTAATIAATDMPTGGTVILHGNVRFPIA